MFTVNILYPERSKNERLQMLTVKEIPDSTSLDVFTHSDMTASLKLTDKPVSQICFENSILARVSY